MHIIILLAKGNSFVSQFPNLCMHVCVCGGGGVGVRYVYSTYPTGWFGLCVCGVGRY